MELLDPECPLLVYVYVQLVVGVSLGHTNLGLIRIWRLQTSHRIPMLHYNQKLGE